MESKKLRLFEIWNPGYSPQETVVSYSCSDVPRWQAAEHEQDANVKSVQPVPSSMEQIDFHHDRREWQSRRRSVEKSANLRPENKEAILRFSDHCFAEGLSFGRVCKVAVQLVLLDKVFGMPFAQATKEDVMKAASWIETSKYSAWYRHDIKVALKKFFRWLRQTEDYPPEVRWMKTTVKGMVRKLPEELLSENEVRRMIEAAEHPRDKALIAVLYDSGCRIAEIGTLRIKGVRFDDYGAQLIVNGKTGMRRVRLLLSVPFLASWLDIHPFKHDPNAPLWISFCARHKHSPFSYSGMLKVFRCQAEKAGVKKRVYPHLFRHSRATALAGKLTEAQLKEMFGWTQSSDQAATYVHLSGRDVDEALLKIYGLKKDESPGQVQSELNPMSCPRCQMTNAATSRFCHRCGMALTIQTAMEVEDARKRWDQAMAEFVSDPEVQQLWKRKRPGLGLGLFG